MNELFVAIVFILTPGILAAVICDKITFHSKWDSLKFGRYTLLLGMLSYLLVQGVLLLYDLASYLFLDTQTWHTLSIWNSFLNSGKDIDFKEVVFATLASIPVSLLAAWTANNRIFNKIARRIGVTTKYGDDNLFFYFLNVEPVDWVRIRDIKNNLTYQGQVAANSENVGIQEIVLEKASVFRYEDSVHYYDSSLIYIARPPGELVIEVIPQDELEKINGRQKRHVR